MQLTEEQLAILDHRCIEGGQLWADRHGNEKWMLEAVAEHKQIYLDAKASEGVGYKTAAQKEADREQQLQDEYDNAPYPEKRRREYPDIGDQLDMVWHAMDTGVLPKVDSFYDTIKTTKDKFPKE